MFIMRYMWMLMFSVLPLLALIYIVWHIWTILPFGVLWKTLIIGIGVACFLLMFFDLSGRLNTAPLHQAQLLYEIGTSSIIIMLYLVMVFLILDIGRLFHLVPRSLLYHNWQSALAIFVLIFCIFLYGNIHYKNKVRVALELKSDKPLSKSYRLVMASDLHLGFHNTRQELARWVDLINAEKPDLILIAGDIIDMSVRPLREENMAEEFRRLNAPVYACLGNHEYFSREPEAKRFYKDAGIHLLQDTVAVVGDLCLIGRDDRTNRERRSVADIMKDADRSKYMILLDHQPYELEKTEQAGIDFQISGHTHRGQVWPISWITDAVYECSWGSYQRGKTQYYVSSGLGIWGGKYRIGTQSEYVVATLQ